MISVHFNYAANHITRNVATARRANAAAMETLSSGYKINKGADGPADLIISEKLRSQIEGLERAIRNTSESGNILGIMEGALGQVQNIITKMSGLAIEAANTGIVSPDRIAANQAEIDAGLQAINRIFETTSYGGRKLLGNMQNRGVIDNNYGGILEAGKLLKENDGLIPDEVYSRDGITDKLYLIARDQEHAAQLSKDGKTIAGEKTFVLPPAEEGGEATELTFAEGTSLADIVSALREHGADYLDLAVPQGGELIPVEEFENLRGLAILGGGAFTRAAGLFGGRTGTDINTVEMSAAQLATLADMSEEKAASSLANYMDNFTREIELDLDGWNKLSDADQAMLMAADHFANMGMDDLASIRDASGEELTLSDLFSGGKASLSKNPAAAIELLNQARKSVTAERAYLGVTMAMNQHSVNAMQAEHENLMRMESYIRDTDMAEAATELTRTNILQQTGMALLRTAQQQNRNIINLIDMTA